MKRRKGAKPLKLSLGRGEPGGKKHEGNTDKEDAKGDSKQKTLEIVTINSPIPMDSVVLVSQDNEELFPSQDSQMENIKGSPDDEGAMLQVKGGVMESQGGVPDESQLPMIDKDDPQMAVGSEKHDMSQIVVHTIDGTKLMAANLWPNLVVPSPTHTENASPNLGQPEEIFNSQELIEMSESETLGEVENEIWSQYKNSKRNKKKKSLPCCGYQKEFKDGRLNQGDFYKHLRGS